MRLLPDQDERDLAAMCRSLLAAQKLDGGHVPPKLWDDLARAGLLGLAIGEQYGGSGGTLSDLGIFCLEAGRALCPDVIHSTLRAALAIDWLGGPGARAAWLPRLTRGSSRATTALWNPRDASILGSPLRAAADAAGRWRLSGMADFVAAADQADLIIVAAETDSATGVFVMDLTTTGVAVEALPMAGGHRAGTVTFDEVPVDDDNRVLGVDICRTALRRVANAAVALLSLDLVGVGEAVVQRTVDYTTMREQFCRPIASFQAAQHLVADMRIALSAARLSAQSAVFWIGRGRTGTRETAIARMHAAAVRQITLDAHQLHGGMGYVVDTDLHLFSERARVLSTWGGGADVAAKWLEGEMNREGDDGQSD
ncbi:acyl-CoA dehydrogenase family protein [Mycobacterium sp. TY815]|uniref:acyl-CoA dehydrogenase family protein n=1 Tax=Mycobacterium sp. TY815 TaxID=3050581 RepID=UPI002741338E|nr:acyl-CoA dehydrogenase family protein [Mycobacterium sp. TY815]MDP7703968.1 acyl-CoA dehydrogenase family protein [Mycobacterium sp. TY815]